MSAADKVARYYALKTRKEAELEAVKGLLSDAVKEALDEGIARLDTGESLVRQVRRGIDLKKFQQEYPKYYDAILEKKLKNPPKPKVEAADVTLYLERFTEEERAAIREAVWDGKETVIYSVRKAKKAEEDADGERRGPPVPPRLRPDLRPGGGARRTPAGARLGDVPGRRLHDREEAEGVSRPVVGPDGRLVSRGVLRAEVDRWTASVGRPFTAREIADATGWGIRDVTGTLIFLNRSGDVVPAGRADNVHSTRLWRRT